MELYERSQTIEAKITNTLARMDQGAGKITEINKLLEELQKKSAVSVSSYLRLALESYTCWTYITWILSV